MSKQSCVAIERNKQVATVRVMLGAERPTGTTGEPNLHGDLANAFTELRNDRSTRVIILTGFGGTNLSLLEKIKSPGYERRGDPGFDWDAMDGVLKCLNAMVESEKPIIAKVNGPATGFFSTMVFASDLIVAREDAIIADHHMGMGDFEVGGKKLGRDDFGVVPGDGGTVFVPFYFTPAMAKEYLLLGKPYTASELAQMHLINYAVPAEKLDETVENIAARLLKRPAYALAWSKRVINRRLIDNFNLTADASLAYEFLNFYMAQPKSRERGGQRGLSEI